MNWYPPPLHPQSGRRYLVTGANAGLGFFTAARLAGAGAHVVMSGRSPERLDAAVSAIRTARPAASVETLVMERRHIRNGRQRRHPRQDPSHVVGVETNLLPITDGERPEVWRMPRKPSTSAPFRLMCTAVTQHMTT